MISATTLLLTLTLAMHGGAREEPRYTFATGYEAGISVEIPIKRIPGLDLRGDPLYLRRDAARAWYDLVEHAAKNGIHLVVNYGFRDYHEQRRLWRQSRRIAARPGYSTHQLGLSVDISGTREFRGGRWRKTALYYWLSREAPRFGFVNDVEREPWHWTYVDEDLS